MSGWIKFEKDIATDPRFLRIVRAYRSNHVTHERFTERAAVTHLLGGLLQLWMYADTHIRGDDTLDLGAEEINDLIGIEGFAQLLPDDWLHVIDQHSVKLPEFQAHNGAEAKKKGLTQKRVERHRQRANVAPLAEVKRTCNAPALPDQTRPDQTRPHTQEGASDPVSRETESASFHYRWVQDEIRRYYPTKIYKDQDWLAAEKQLMAIIEGNLATRAELETWAREFAKQQQALGREGSQFVPNPARFYDHKQAAWRGPFQLPIDPKQAAKQAAEAATLARITTHAENIGCPIKRREHEPLEMFEARIRDWEKMQRPREQGAPKFANVAALAKSKTVGAA